MLASAFDFVHIQGTISVGVDATDLFDRYDEDFEEMPGGGFPHIEINKMHISQSIEVCIYPHLHLLCVLSLKEKLELPCHFYSCNHLALRLL